jgi:hypothetical protein
MKPEPLDHARHVNESNRTAFRVQCYMRGKAEWDAYCVAVAALDEARAESAKGRAR